MMKKVTWGVVVCKAAMVTQLLATLKASLKGGYHQLGALCYMLNLTQECIPREHMISQGWYASRLPMRDHRW